MNSQSYITHSEEEMVALGERIAHMLPRPAVILLSGDLGAGKTTLTKGIVKGLGAAEPEEVSSPTFTLIHEYGDPTSVYHIDLYRLDQARELATLGLDEIFDREAVVIVEWADKFPQWMPSGHLAIHITDSGGQRTVTLSGIPLSPEGPQS
ncbi:MAG: tRNA (adenosine(37)-N6)-threonylcarbamoyltransferase complex ATPase subunit type 1 TsaE [Bryobacteraceae bacterium]|nr:tRNA (adenosine(37)-N6)-threonylcarbamoyltransferase complex ATPase subunit type 1 TsaE [Bryobacteraceae bacterium]